MMPVVFLGGLCGASVISVLRSVFSLRRLGTILLAVLFASTLFAACRSKPTLARGEYFPQAVEGWSKSGETRIFPSQHLFEYIDGDAERYLKAGVEQTLTSDYRYRDKIDAVADVFIMKNAAGATEVFESQPANGSEWVQVGDAARIYPGTLMFRKGRVFVRLVAYASGPEIQSVLLSLARSIGDKIQ